MDNSYYFREDSPALNRNMSPLPGMSPRNMSPPQLAVVAPRIPSLPAMSPTRVGLPTRVDSPARLTPPIRTSPIRLSPPTAPYLGNRTLNLTLPTRLSPPTAPYLGNRTLNLASPTRLSPPTAPYLGNRTLNLSSPRRAASPTRLSPPESIPNAALRLHLLAQPNTYLDVSKTNIFGAGTKSKNKLPSTAILLGTEYPLNRVYFSNRINDSMTGALNFLTLYHGNANMARNHLERLYNM